MSTYRLYLSNERERMKNEMEVLRGRRPLPKGVKVGGLNKYGNQPLPDPLIITPFQSNKDIM